MITVTKPKPLEEILPSLDKAKKVFLIGCGTCATICHTGGRAEVLAMKEKLEAEGKKVTGWMVIPTACDELSREALALNTLFVGKEETPGHFIEVCMQCGNCVLATTVGICPLVRCAKSLLNGPCGGSVDGKCEVSPDTPCAWQLIYDRLKALGQLDKMEEIVPVRDWSTSSSGGPRRFVLSDETDD
jgi:ferredoxin